MSFCWEIRDRHDDLLPKTGPVVLRDAETGRLALVNGKKLAEQHRQQREKERADLLATVRKLGIDHLEIDTRRPYLGPLVRFFQQRRRRRSNR